MPKDHYISLGISQGADFKKIKKAYRKIVKEVHPDITRSEESVEKFLEIRKAYETLADEEKRRRYDQEQKKQASHVKVKKTPVIRNRRASISNDLNDFFSPADMSFKDFPAGFLGKDIPGTGEKNLFFEAILSSSEARSGGLFPVSVPVHEHCARCDGTGYLRGFFCPVCSGHGIVDYERVFSLNMPPKVKHGTEITLYLEDIGLKDVFLHVRVLIVNGVLNS